MKHNKPQTLYIILGMYCVYVCWAILNATTTGSLGLVPWRKSGKIQLTLTFWKLHKTNSNCLMIQIFCTEYGRCPAMLCAKSQDDCTTETTVMDKHFLQYLRFQAVFLYCNAPLTFASRKRWSWVFIHIRFMFSFILHCWPLGINSVGKCTKANNPKGTKHEQWSYSSFN